MGLTAGALLLAAGLNNAQVSVQGEQAYIAEIAKFRKEREHLLRTGPFARLARVHVELIRNHARVTIGSGQGADLRLPGQGIAPLHAAIEGTTDAPTLKAVGAKQLQLPDDQSTQELILKHNTGFRIGRYNLQYIVDPQLGRTIWVTIQSNRRCENSAGSNTFPWMLPTESPPR